MILVLLVDAAATWTVVGIMRETRSGWRSRWQYRSECVTGFWAASWGSWGFLLRFLYAR